MANGKFAGGDGSQNNPYLIEDAFDLDAVRNGLDKRYKLIKDIDLNISPFNQGEGWVSINCFTAVFDGDGHKIKNLLINRMEKPTQGLFINLIGLIKNLTLDNCNIKADVSSSILVGGSSYGIIENCSVINSKISSKCDATWCGNIGLLCSICHTGDSKIGQIKNCRVQGEIEILSESTISYVGGITGQVSANCTVRNCYSCVSIKGEVNSYSAIGGYNNTSIIQKVFYDSDVYKNSLSDKIIGLAKTEFEASQTFIGASWDKEVLNDGTKIWTIKNGKYPMLWFEKNIKYLMQDKSSVLYTFNGNDIIKSPSQTLNEDNFKINGCDNITVIPEEKWDDKFPNKSDIKILIWTDDMDKQEEKLSYECEPFNLIDWLKKDECKLLVYTDDLEKKECEMIYNCNTYKPLDILKKNNEGKFEVLMKEV